MKHYVAIITHSGEMTPEGYRLNTTVWIVDNVKVSALMDLVEEKFGPSAHVVLKPATGYILEDQT